MIYITRNTTNKIALDLQNNVTITSPIFFIFSFQHYSTTPEYTNLIYYTTPDISDYVNRYNLFEIFESDPDASPLGDIYLKPGQYEYKVYQSDSNSLDPNTFGNLLQTGRMVVGDMTIEGQDTYVDSVYQ